MIGTVTYLTPLKYTLPRQLPWAVGINADIYPTDNPLPGIFHLYAPSAVPYTLFTFKLFDHFVPWKKVAYTMDNIIEECYYQNPPFTTKIPADVTVGIFLSPALQHMYIRFGAFGYTGAPHFYTLQDAPFGYWNRSGFPIS